MNKVRMEVFAPVLRNGYGSGHADGCGGGYPDGSGHGFGDFSHSGCAGEGNTDGSGHGFGEIYGSTFSFIFKDSFPSGESVDLSGVGQGGGEGDTNGSGYGRGEGAGHPQDFYSGLNRG